MRLKRAYTSVAMKPSGWPTCSPTPLGYGNMSSTKRLGPVGEVARILGEQPGAVGRPEHVLGVPTVLPRVLDLVGERRVVAVRRDVVGALDHAPERSGRAPKSRVNRLVT